MSHRSPPGSVSTVWRMNQPVPVTPEQPPTPRRSEAEPPWEGADLAVHVGEFHSTVLVGVRVRLRRSDRPRRLFEDVKAVAKAAGLLAGVTGCSTRPRSTTPCLPRTR